MATDNTVFRFEVICTSKQLGGALAALTGMVAQVSPPQMIANATAQGNGAVQMSSAELNEMFLAYLRKKKLTEFKPDVVREFLREHGRSPNSYSYLLAKLKAAGQVKNMGDSPSNARWALAGAAKSSKATKRTPAKKPVRPRVRTIVKTKSQPSKAAEA